MAKKILVTGAGGFLGGFVLKELAGNEIFAVVRKAPVESVDGVTWIEANLSNVSEDLHKLPENIDAVIHLAQSPEYRNGPDGEEDVLAVNVTALGQLLRYACNAGAKSFVSASTGTVYEPFDGRILKEEEALAPTGYYGASKAAAEMLANAYADRMSGSNLRVFFLYGEGQKDMLIARLIDRIDGGNPVTVPAGTDGLVFVPTHAADTAKVFVKACLEGWNGAYNVACPEAISFRSLFKEIAGALGKEVTIEEVEGNAPASIVPDTTKLSEKYDVSSFMNFQAGIQRTVSIQKDGLR